MKRLLGCWVSALLLPLFCVAQPEACRTVRDVPYREAGDSLRDDPMCRLDLVCPAGAEGFPTVVWFHGGGLTGGRREIPEELLAGGFAVAGVEYRLSPQTPVAGCLEDAAAAVAWVVRHIASYGGDPELIFLAGHSAGGYLVSMLGLDKRWLAAQGLDHPDRRALELYGPMFLLMSVSDGMQEKAEALRQLDAHLCRQLERLSTKEGEK